MTFQATVAAQALTLSLALGCGESLPVSDSAEPSPGVTASSTNGGSMGEDGAPNPRPEPSQGPNDATGGNAGGSNAAGSVGGSSNAPGGGSPGQMNDPAPSGDDGNGGSAGSAVGPSVNASCKRGIASNIAPGEAFLPGISWWYAWSSTSATPDVGIEFVPMIWDERGIDATLPASARFLLGFNEPNFGAQADLTAAEAASFWPDVEALADAAGIPIVSPAVNFCGGDCNGTDPYLYLRDFFAACQGCRVDYVAVHWYNCDLASLRDYLEPGGALEGFEQFAKPLWLTEFACAIGNDTSPAAQEAYMREAIPYLEQKANVFRYSWFSAGPIPNAILMNDDGSPNALGEVYRNLPGACP